MHIFCRLQNIWLNWKISRSIIFIEFSVCMAVNKILNSLVAVTCCYRDDQPRDQCMSAT